HKILFGASLERDRTMEFKADPVTGKDDVYDYYLAFARDPELFVASPKEPSCPVYMKKKRGATWYWIPTSAGGVFLQLVLKTTFLRGPDTPPPTSWPTMIEDITFLMVDGKPYKTPE